MWEVISLGTVVKILPALYHALKGKKTITINIIDPYCVPILACIKYKIVVYIVLMRSAIDQ